jgi:hypothetical protein
MRKNKMKPEKKEEEEEIRAQGSIMLCTVPEAHLGLTPSKLFIIHALLIRCR